MMIDGMPVTDSLFLPTMNGEGSSYSAHVVEELETPNYEYHLGFLT